MEWYEKLAVIGVLFIMPSCMVWDLIGRKVGAPMLMASISMLAVAAVGWLAD